MSNKVLVAFATKYGATEAIAQRIGQTLSEAGLPVDILPAEHVGDVLPYRAVVLGSAVYAGNWRKEAAQFLETFQLELATRPVWLFSSGPTGEGEPVELMHGWRFPEALQQLADRVYPRDIAVFHGDINTGKLNIGERLLVKVIRAPVGDFREWDVIQQWAHDIARALTPAHTEAVHA